MAIKVGNTTASLYLGSTPVAAYLGAEQVYSAGPTVPGAPTTTDEEWNGFVTILSLGPPASDGGSAITGYRFYFDNVLVEPDAIDDSFFEFSANYSGQTVEVSAVNAVGEGPRSAGAVIADNG